MLALADHPVPWAYAVWDDVVAELDGGAQRWFAAELLLRLVHSDPERRFLKALKKLEAALREPEFPRSSHALQRLSALAMLSAEHSAQIGAVLQRLARVPEPRAKATRAVPKLNPQLSDGPAVRLSSVPNSAVVLPFANAAMRTRSPNRR